MSSPLSGTCRHTCANRTCVAGKDFKQLAVHEIQSVTQHPDCHLDKNCPVHIAYMEHRKPGLFLVQMTKSLQEKKQKKELAEKKLAEEQEEQDKEEQARLENLAAQIFECRVQFHPRCQLDQQKHTDFSVAELKKLENGAQKAICDLCASWIRRANNKNYNITVEKLSEMFNAQGKKCPVCMRALGDDVHLDHHHTKKHSRGLLHRQCNLSLAKSLRADDFARAAVYLAIGEKVSNKTTLSRLRSMAKEMADAADEFEAEMDD